jgi:hypothetical protein
MIGKFLIFQVMILVPFLAGPVVKRKFRDPSKLSKGIININLIFIEPLIVFWSVWGLSLNKNFIILPLAGVLMVFLGMSAGAIFNTILKLADKKRATFLIGSCLANHGFTMGGFLCYLLFGEKGLALSLIFISYFMPLIFLFIFPYARGAGRREQVAETTGLKRLRPFFLSLQNMPLYALLTAVILQLAGLARPEYNLSLDPLLLTSVGLYYFSLGTNFRSVDIKGALKENLALGAIKFLIVPLVVFIFLKWLPLETAAKQVIMLEAFMPVAIYSVISSILFDLDSGLASGMFVLNTLFFLFLVLPFIVLGGKIIFAF